MSDSAGWRPDDRLPSDDPAGDSAIGAFTGRNAVVTTGIVTLVTIVAFEAMALSAIMPRIADELNAVRSYSLAFSALLTAQLLGIVLAGVWTERHGPVPGLTTGQVLLAGGSLLCAVAPTFALFIAGRVVAGLGGGVLLVMLYVVVGRTYAASVRPKVFTLISAAWVVPSLVGAPIAAWLTEALGWRAVFWVLVPPILLVAGVMWSQAAAMGDRLGALDGGRDHHEHVRAAWAGVGIAAAAGALQWGTTGLDERLGGHLAAAVLGLVGIGVVAPHLVPAGTWRMARGLPSVLASRAMMTGAFFGSLTYAPLMLVRERHLGLALAGIIVSVGSLGWAAGSFVQGLDRFAGRRWRLVVVGGGLLAVSLAVMGAAAVLGWPTATFAVAFAFGGLGMGLCVASQAVLCLELAPPEDHGLASSALMLADVLGSVVGIALAGAAFAVGHARHGSDATTYGVIWFGLALVAAVVVVAGRRIRTRPS